MTKQVATKMANANAREVPETRKCEVEPKRVKINSEGFAWRDILVRMPKDAVTDDLRDPAIWKAVQITRGSALIKLDRLFILGYDESWYADAVVTAATDTEAHLRVLKTGTFREPDSENLFNDGTYYVEWANGGYRVLRCADNVPMSGYSFATVTEAANYVRSLYPKVVA